MATEATKEVTKTNDKKEVVELSWRDRSCFSAFGKSVQNGEAVAFAAGVGAGLMVQSHFNVL